MVTPFFCLGYTCPSFSVTGLVLLIFVPVSFLGLVAAAAVVSSSESCSSSIGEMWSLSSWSERLSSLPRALSFAGEPSKYSSSSFRAGSWRFSGTTSG